MNPTKATTLQLEIVLGEGWPPSRWHLFIGLCFNAVYFAIINSGNDDSRFVENAGGGVKIDIAPSTDLRIDLRGYIVDDAYGSGTTTNWLLNVGLGFKNM